LGRCIGGALSGCFLYNKENNYGACTRALGKVVLYMYGRLAFAWEELKFNWKAWRVYERSFKKIEMLDRCAHDDARAPGPEGPRAVG
jgi:hypothetical protein